MVSLVFVLLVYHVIMDHFTWHDIDMTSSHLHHIHIVHVTLSCSHCDIITFMHESQLKSWLVTRRHLHDLNACNHEIT